MTSIFKEIQVGLTGTLVGTWQTAAVVYSIKRTAHVECRVSGPVGCYIAEMD